jgi:hypothetical protein
MLIGSRNRASHLRSSTLLAMGVLSDLISRLIASILLGVEPYTQ